MDRRGKQGEEYLDAPTGDPQSNVGFSRRAITRVRTVRGQFVPGASKWPPTVQCRAASRTSAVRERAASRGLNIVEDCSRTRTVCVWFAYAD